MPLRAMLLLWQFSAVRQLPFLLGRFYNTPIGLLSLFRVLVGLCFSVALPLGLAACLCGLFTFLSSCLDLLVGGRDPQCYCCVGIC